MHGGPQCGFRRAGLLLAALGAVVAAGMLLPGCAAPPPAGSEPDGFYVWQRQWSEAVAAAVKAESGPIFPLVCEVRGREAAVAWSAPDWELLRTLEAPTLVMRVEVAALGSPRLDAVLGDVLNELAGRLGAAPENVQLDVDCPESRLDEYARLLGRVRGMIPGTRISVTALPCHLARREFAAVARQVDYYVLQIHGLEVPSSIGAPASLMDPTAARRAIAAAGKLGAPYRIAMPCYGYEVNFDRQSGRFHHLNAEAWQGHDPTMAVRIMAADPGELAGMVCELRNSRSASGCRGIVWFRLPVPGDRLTWDRATVKKLQDGAVPETGYKARWQQDLSGAWELWVENSGMLGHRGIRVALGWAAPAGDGDPLNGFTAGDALPGVLPAELKGMPPPPGMAQKIAWFRPADEQPAQKILITMETE